MNGEQQPKRSTSPWVWVGCGCAALIAGAIAFVVFIFVAVFGAIRASDPYKAGVARATNDARVQEALGAPVKPGWLIGGSINTKNRDGDCDLSVPLQGTKKSGVLRVVGTKSDGQWSYSRMEVSPSTGPAIDLLRESSSTAPPGG
jgi:Cytochrome oxidase complex assembly protein 1